MESEHPIDHAASTYAEAIDKQQWREEGFSYLELIDAFVAGYNQCLSDNDIREDS